MLEEIFNARRKELDLQALRIRHRMEWEALLRIDALERALRTARHRFATLANRSVQPE